MIVNNSKSIRVRFAPSPTGFLHLGGARTAIFSWALAKHYQGTFILRIEDTDTERSSKEAVTAILDSMKWLDIMPDEGPYYQMERIGRYRNVIEQMLLEGTAYYCYCSHTKLELMREEARRNLIKPKYDYTCRPESGKDLSKIQKSKHPVIRFKNKKTGNTSWKDFIKGPISFNNEELDDFIIARSNGIPTYNFCVVIDDLDMNITHVLRGEDHVNNTPKQINLIKALNQCIPQYGHIPMILGPDGQKLSKRHGSVSIMDYKEKGYLPEALVNYLARLGWSHGNNEIFDKNQLAEWFDISKISKSSAKWDLKKLNWINSHYIKNTDNSKLEKLVAPYIQAKGIHKELNNLDSVINLTKNRSETLLDIANIALIFYEDFVLYDKKLEEKYINLNSINLLQIFFDQAKNIEWNQEKISFLIKNIIEQNNIKMFELCAPLRISITGREHTPSIDSLLTILGKDTTLRRLENYIHKYKNLNCK